MNEILDINIIFFFIGVLLLVTLFYIRYQEKNFLSSSFFLILLSYLQGLLISLCFSQQDFFTLFTYWIVFGVLYYLTIPKICFILILSVMNLINRKDKSEENFDNDRIIDFIVNEAHIPREIIEIKYYGSENFENAFRQYSVKKIKIFLGRGFKKLNFDELLFVISHEVGHTRIEKRSYLRFFGFGIFFIIMCEIISLVLPVTGVLTIYSFFFITLILYLVGIMGFNYIFWSIEFDADKFAIELIKNHIGADSFLLRYRKTQKDFYTIINLLLYDHPSINERLSRVKMYGRNP